MFGNQPSAANADDFPFSKTMSSSFIDLPTIKEVSTLPQGQNFRTIAVLHGCKTATSARGSEYIKAEFSDKTLSIHTNIWDSFRAYQELKSGQIKGAVLLAGTTDFYNGGFSPKITEISPIPEDQLQDVMERLVPVSKRPLAEMQAELDATIESISKPELRTAVRECIARVGRTKFENAPAGRRHHHACLHGLLEHTLSMVRTAKLLYPHYSTTVPLNIDAIVSAIVVHDCCKTMEYEDGLGWNFTPFGSLVGHIAGAFGVWSKCARDANVSNEDMLGIAHIIPSHHGEKEWGSPVEPVSCSATFVHMLDLLDSRMGGLAIKAIEGTLEQHQRY